MISFWAMMTCGRFVLGLTTVRYMLSMLLFYTNLFGITLRLNWNGSSEGSFRVREIFCSFELAMNLNWPNFNLQQKWTFALCCVSIQRPQSRMILCSQIFRVWKGKPMNSETRITFPHYHSLDNICITGFNKCIPQDLSVRNFNEKKTLLYSALINRKGNRLHCSHYWQPDLAFLINL